MAAKPGSPAARSSFSMSEPESYNETKRINTSAIVGLFFVVFISNTDESIIYSIYSAVSSDFHRLSDGAWVLTGYNLAYCVALPVYGKLSDLYNRKQLLLSSYILLTIGCIACGASTSLPLFILARMIIGISASGVSVLVSVILTDLVPPRDLAIYRSYEFTVAITARSLGAPMGGFITDIFGWRWAFFCQVPLVIACIVLGAYKLPTSLKADPLSQKVDPTRPRLRDLDFGGLLSFTATIILLLILLQGHGSVADADAEWLPLLIPVFLASLICFVFIELFWARHPLIPIELMGRSLGGYCFVQVLAVSGRMIISSNLVPYFIRVEKASEFIASLSYILPPIGGTVGSLVAGRIIKRTGRYKTITLIAICINILVSLAIFLTWRDGCTIAEAMLLLPVGIAMTTIYSAQFIGMSASVPKESLSSCISTYFIFQQLGFIIGPAAGLAMVQNAFAGDLSTTLGDIPDKNQLIGKVLNEAKYSWTLPSALQEKIRSSYLFGFQFVPLFTAACNVIILPAVLLIQEVRLSETT